MRMAEVFQVSDLPSPGSKYFSPESLKLSFSGLRKKILTANNMLNIQQHR